MNFFAAEANGRQKFVGAVSPSLNAEALQFHDKGDVFPGIEHRHEVKGLKNKSDAVQAKLDHFAVAEPRDLGAVDPNPSRSYTVESADGIQERGFAAARGAYQRREGSALKFQRNAADCLHRAGSGFIGFYYVLNA